QLEIAGYRASSAGRGSPASFRIAYRYPGAPDGYSDCVLYRRSHERARPLGDTAQRELALSPYATVRSPGETLRHYRSGLIRAIREGLLFSQSGPRHDGSIGYRDCHGGELAIVALGIVALLAAYRH